VVLSADPAAELSAVAGADAAIWPGAFATAVPEQARGNLQGTRIQGSAPNRSFGVPSYAQYLQVMAQQSVAPQQHSVPALLPPRDRGGGGAAWSCWTGVTGSSGDLCCACTGCQRTAKMGCHGWRKFNQPSIVHEPLRAFVAQCAGRIMSPSRSPYEWGVEGNKWDCMSIHIRIGWEQGRRFSFMVAWKMFDGAALL